MGEVKNLESYAIIGFDGKFFNNLLIDVKFDQNKLF